MIEELERKGDVLVMRSLTGLFKDPPLPKLGQANVHGLKINDGGSGGYQRMRSVWWDDTRERGKAGTRVDDGERKTASSKSTLSDLTAQSSLQRGTKFRSLQRMISSSCLREVSSTFASNISSD